MKLFTCFCFAVWCLPSEFGKMMPVSTKHKARLTLNQSINDGVRGLKSFYVTMFFVPVLSDVDIFHRIGKKL